MATAEINVRPSEAELVEHWRAKRLELRRLPAGRRGEARGPHGRRPSPCRRAARQGLLGRARAADPAVTPPTRAESPDALRQQPSRLHPLAAHGRRPRRAAAAAHVRPHAARCDPRGDLADRPPLGRSWRGVGARHPGRGLGRRLRRRRRAPLPRHHLVERGAEPEVAGHLRGLEGRARRLGRHRPRRARRRASSSAARARAPRCSPTLRRPASCSRRRSGGSGTGGTRSSTASRRTSPGR